MDLAEYTRNSDRNKFWELPSGVAQNLLDEAIDRLADLEAQLAKIAHIAHNDGLDNLTEAEALGRICILSLAWRDRKEE